MAKLQDTLEIFFDKLESVDQKFDINNKINFILDQKITEIQQTSIKIETKAYEKLVEKNSDLIDKHTKELSLLIQKHSDTITRIGKKENKYQLYFYSALTTFFCLCLSSVTFGINQFNKNQETERLLLVYANHNNRMEKYLNYKNLTDSYKNWKPQSKNTTKD